MDYILDKDLRTIPTNRRSRILGVEGDKDVNSVSFRCERYYKGVDLSTFGIKISFLNANGDAGWYDVTDAVADNEYIRFTWLVSDLAVAYKGVVRFSVNFRELDGTDVKRSYNSTIVRGKSLVGLPTPTSYPASQYEDLLAKINASGGNNVKIFEITTSEEIDIDNTSQKLYTITSGFNYTLKEYAEAYSSGKQMYAVVNGVYILQLVWFEDETGFNFSGLVDNRKDLNTDLNIVAIEYTCQNYDGMYSATIKTIPMAVNSSTSDYEQLSNKPSINTTTLTGNKTFDDLGIGDLEADPDDISKMI